MASQRQIDANRQNATKSTGPKTEDGKNSSKFNALKHGLSAATPVLPHEDLGEYAKMRAALTESFEPVGELEFQLIDHLAYAQWRLLRTERVEIGTLNLYVRTLKSEQALPTQPEQDDDNAITCVFRELRQKDLANWFRYQSMAERSYYRAAQALQRAQIERLRKQEKMAKLAAAPKPKPAQETRKSVSVAPQSHEPETEIGFVPQPSLNVFEISRK